MMTSWHNHDAANERRPTTSRRSFIRHASAAVGMGLGAMACGGRSAAAADASRARRDRLPREVWVATISQEKMEAGSYQQMIRSMLARMKEVAALQPDIICLPEVFPFVNLPDGRPPLAKVAERPIGAVSRPFAQFAAEHGCYVVCPIYTQQEGQFYNAAVFIDRSGNLLGEYRKMHPTIGEMERGVAPGPLEPPVFKTDFGTVGAQICFDIEWHDGWQKLRRAGAEIIFWPSAFAGGSMVNTKAWENKVCVVSSTRKDTSKICDISGEALAWTDRWNRWACAPVNLEKIFLHTWPYCQRFGEIRAKYGQNVRIRSFGEEEWTIIESRSADLRVADLKKEFDLKTHEEHIRAAELAQDARRS